MPLILTRSILDRLLAEFAALPRSGTRERTLLQIAGYPQLEDVASNILQFYLDPSGGHGLGSLLLDTLLTFLPETGTGSAQSVRVEREVITAGGKRIDIVVTSDTLILGIENKINHAIINPFDEYVAHMQRISEGQPVLGVILSYRPIVPSPSHAGFVPVSYARYFGRVLERLGPALLHAREPYLTFLRDFIRTMQDSNEERMLDPSMLDYLQKRRLEVETLLRATDSFHRMSVQKLKALTNAIASHLDTQSLVSGLSAGYPGCMISCITRRLWPMMLPCESISTSARTAGASICLIRRVIGSLTVPRSRSG